MRLRTRGLGSDDICGFQGWHIIPYSYSYPCFCYDIQMNRPTHYLIECAAWLKVVTTYLAYLGEAQMTAEADSVRNALVALENNLSALIADLATMRQNNEAMTVTQADAEANAAALLEAQAKLEELNNIIIGAKQ